MGSSFSKANQRALDQDLPDSDLNPHECHVRAMAILQSSDGFRHDESRAERLLNTAVESSHAPSAYALGKIYHDSGRYMQRVVELYRIASAGGDSKAQYSLATILENGSYGVQSNVREAVDLYERAVQAGHSSAMAHLGNLYFSGSVRGVPVNLTRAHQLFRKALAKGNNSAACPLAILTQKGEGGVRKDLRTAISLYELALENNDNRARRHLAFLYAYGDDELETNLDRAAAVYSGSDGLPTGRSFQSLAKCFHHGKEGAKKHIPTAIALYKRAITARSSGAVVDLAVLYASGEEGVEADLNRAAEVFATANEVSHNEALYELAVCCHHGKGVSKKIPLALKLYERAIAANNLDATFGLASLYINDNGDGQRAVEIYQGAINLGNARAMHELAELFRYGKAGVRKDVSSAIRLYEKAIGAGYIRSRYSLAILYASRNDDGDADDLEHAANIYREATGLVRSEALFKLAVILLHGKDGARKNMQAAVKLFNISISAGNGLAAMYLANLYRDGEGVDSDIIRSVGMYQEAIGLGDVKSLALLGLVYQYGKDALPRNTGLALSLFEQSWNHKDPFGGYCLAMLLLTEDAGLQRNPTKARAILEILTNHPDPLFIPAAHELAVLLGRGDVGVEPDPETSERLYARASHGTYANVIFGTRAQAVFESGADYTEIVNEALSTGTSVPKKCLLLTLGGGGRGKTCTVNSIRRMPFVVEHIPTEMADLATFIADPGARLHNPNLIAEADFQDGSLRANASRIKVGMGNCRMPSYQLENSTEGPSPHRRQGLRKLGPPVPREDDEAIIQQAAHEHADVIDRVRHALVDSGFPTSQTEGIVQVWDMAGQVSYEMAHSLFIARARVLLFVTNLKQVSCAETRAAEVSVLCHWMQIAHSLLLDPTDVFVIIAGTHKAECTEGEEHAFHVLREELVEQLSGAVYNSWIQRQENGSRQAAFVAIENSISQQDREGSGLVELERVIRKASDQIIEERWEIPVRWFAFVDKLLRDSKLSFSKIEIEAICHGFPGYPKGQSRRNADVRRGLKIFASMGTIVLFEVSEDEWYVFTDVEQIVNLVGMTVKPENTLSEYLTRTERLELKDGFLSKNALFKLWGDRPFEDKKRVLRLLIEFDLLMDLRSESDSSGLVGVPALFRQGWDEFTWNRSEDEKDLQVSTKFSSTIPLGVVGRLMAFLHRTLGEEMPLRPIVRQDAALFAVEGAGRVFVCFQRTERTLFWKFRSADPVRLAKICLQPVEDLIRNRKRGLGIDHKQVVLYDCSSSKGGCGSKETISIELSAVWINDDSKVELPKATTGCTMCFKKLPLELVSGFVELAPVIQFGKYDAFISHAGPDKDAMAEPLYDALKNIGWRPFLDRSELKCSTDSAPEVMNRAMNEAKLGIFILSPEYAARKWPMKELSTFLRRNREAAEGRKPALLPVFYRLSLQETPCVYNDDSIHNACISDSEYVSGCSFPEKANLRAAMASVTMYSGIEIPRLEGDASATVVARVVRSVQVFMERNNMDPDRSN